VLPQPVTRTVVSWDPEYPAYCGRVYSDGAGNLYTNTQYTTSNETSVLLQIGGLLATLNAGFAAITFQTKTEAHLNAYAPDGKVLSSTPRSGRAWVAGHSTAGVQARGGIVSIDADCSVSKAIRVVRIDPEGILTGPVELADQGCLTFPPSSYFAGLVDAANRLLIATDGASLGSGAIPSDHSAARWFDSGGQPLTAWFNLGPGQPTSLRPIIGGGVAIHFSNVKPEKNGWVASIASGAPVFFAPPPAPPGSVPSRSIQTCSADEFRRGVSSARPSFQTCTVTPGSDAAKSGPKARLGVHAPGGMPACTRRTQASAASAVKRYPSGT